MVVTHRTFRRALVKTDGVRGLTYVTHLPLNAYLFIFI